MKKNLFRRLGTVICTAAVSVSALAMFAGCSTKHPEITINYEFDGKKYAVDYVLSRNDAPQTVQHFIELANAGFYDGTIIHDYRSSFLYGGGYKVENGELTEIDYYSTVKTLEEEGNTFTQSVWTLDDTPLYTVYGEFFSNGTRNQYRTENYHKAGALVMYYTDKGNYNGDVKVLRADGGKGNGGNPYQETKYPKNSATSLFYTYTSTASQGTLDDNYSVFGMAKDYEGQLENGLLKAINDYTKTLAEDVSFTTEINWRLNRYEPFEALNKGDIDATFNVPLEKQIVITSVKVNKY